MQHSPTPTSLRVDGRHSSPAGDRFVALASEPRPRLSWTVPLIRDRQRQAAFHVRLCLAPLDPRGEDNPALFDSGEVSGAAGFVELDDALDPDILCLWTVRVRDETGTWSAWAEPEQCETGPWDLGDWAAEWVAHPPLTTLRRTFTLDAPVIRARLHLTAQGLVRASVNAVPVNADSSDPSRTDRVRALYRTYDVTDLVAVGGNVIDFAMGRGEWERTGEDPNLLAELVTVTADGTVVRIGTGNDLLAAESEVTHDEPFYLESHQHIEGTQVFAPSHALRVLSPDAAPYPPSEVTPDPSPPLHRVAQHAVTELARTADARVYDVGENIAGRTRVQIISPVPTGTVVRVVHGEHLDTDGRLDTTNLTMPTDNGRLRQAVEYTVGAASEALEPWFAFHGFRYVEVLGLPLDAEVSVEAWSVHSQVDDISDLTTDDAEVNALARAAQRTLRNNLHGIPEDCPTREQSGWTGDTASAAEFSCSAFDMQAFFTKWLADLRTSQQQDGSIPAISPDLRVPRISADPVWGAALPRVLLGHWLHYGDARVLRETLPAVRRWADYLLTLRNADGIIGDAAISYGSDWLALVQTPPELHHTGAVIDCLEALATLEEGVGDRVAASARRAQADDLRRAMSSAFYDADRDVFGNGTQGADSVAIESRAVVGSAAKRAAERIALDIRGRGGRFSSGFATTRTVVRALASTGHSQTIFDALHQPEEPGIGAMLVHGPGTFWECWWIDPTNTGTGSLDHIGLGGPIAGWAWQSLAGVRPTGPAWSRFEVAPQFVDGIDVLSLSTRTVRGTIELRYRVEGTSATVDLTVPVGAEATLCLPGCQDEVLEAGWHTRTVTVLRAPRGQRPQHTALHPPFRPERSPDVVGEQDWLTRAIDRDTFSAPGDVAVTVIDDLQCMPVPHEQPSGRVLLVQGAQRTPPGIDGPGAALLVQLPVPDAATERTDTTFVYATFDLCLPNPARDFESVIRVRGADGSVAESTHRIWPAGWNRITVDVSQLAARTSLESVEVGVRVRAQKETPYSIVSTHEDAPLAFHLGEVGCSTTRPTW